MAMPNNARMIRKMWSEGAKAEDSSKMENAMMSIINVGRRPKRSAISPKRNAPTGRIASVRKIAFEDGGDLRVKFSGDSADAKNQDEKIKGVERPAEKAGDEGVALDAK